MRIEFAAIGDGANVEVLLLEDISGSEVKKDRFYTQQRQFQFCARPGKPEYMSCEKFFAYLEEMMLPPVIGGNYAYLHPYREERKVRRRERQDESNGN